MPKTPRRNRVQRSEPKQPFSPADIDRDYAAHAQERLTYGAVDEDTDDRPLVQERIEAEQALSDEFSDDVLRESMVSTATEVQTGGFTPGGETQDLTMADLGYGRHMGGPTGGDVVGAGAGGGGQMVSRADTACGVDKPFSDQEDTGMARKTATDNVEAELREDSRHGKPQTP